MSSFRPKSLLGSAVAATLILCAPAGAALAADDFPNKTIRLVVPWAPGGFTDTLGRVLAEKMARSFNQPVIVENRPGASGSVGSDFVARSAPDGYTLLIKTSDSTVRLMQDKGMNPEKDFTQVSLLASQPVVLGVGAGVPVNTLGDFVKRAKEKPGQITYGSSGEGSAVHLAMELFASEAGIKLNHIPYKGINPALTDVLGGQVDSIFISFQSSAGNFASGKLKPLAITSAKRTPTAPDLPTVAESGYPNFQLTLWYVLSGPKDMPAAVVEKLNKAAVAAMAEPDIRERLMKAATDPIGSSAAEATAFVKDEVAKWGRVIK